MSKDYRYEREERDLLEDPHCGHPHKAWQSQERERHHKVKQQVWQRKEKRRRYSAHEND